MNLPSASGRILLVDDEPDITAVLKNGLDAHGFETSTYNNPVAVLAEYKPNWYDFHILDIRMPVMNGFDLARAIWEKDPKAQICFLSAFEIYADEAKKVFKDLKSNCFIRKPITASALVHHLQLHLATAR